MSDPPKDVKTADGVAAQAQQPEEKHAPRPTQTEKKRAPRTPAYRAWRALCAELRKISEVSDCEHEIEEDGSMSISFMWSNFAFASVTVRDKGSVETLVHVQPVCTGGRETDLRIITTVVKSYAPNVVLKHLAGALLNICESFA